MMQDVKNVTVSMLAAAVAALTTTAVAAAYDGQELASQAKISIAHARAIALHAVPGKIVKEELEKEKGGSGLRYSFDVKTTTNVREVGIDAKNGKVLENAVDIGGD